MTSDVLVLNASYEPLARVSWQRAVVLVVADKARIEEEVEGKTIRSQHGELPWPKVILLKKYVKLPYIWKEIPFSKSGVLKRDNYVCVYCSGKADTVEHILPQSTHPHLSRDWLNCVAACQPCNAKRGDRPLEETNMVMKYQPYVPQGVRRK